MATGPHLIEERNNRMKPVALQLYTVREYAEKDFLRTLQQVAEAGYKGVEPAGYYGCDAHQVRRFLDDLDLVVCSDHIQLETFDDIDQLVETAQILGHDHPVSGLGHAAFESVDAIKAGAEKFQKLAEAIKPHGLKLGYHNHCHEMRQFNGRYGLEIFLEEAPDVQAQIDVYWASNYSAVDVPNLISKYADRTPSLHIKDGPLVKGATQNPVGAGKMDIPACVGAADPDVLKWLIVELDNCEIDMMQAIRDSLQYLTSAALGEANK